MADYITICIAVSVHSFTGGIEEFVFLGYYMVVFMPIASITLLCPHWKLSGHLIVIPAL
jgi:hypothetical protein